MILLFGKAAKSQATQKNNNIKNHPVENSGILAMNPSTAKSLLTMGEYDEYISSNPIMINYAMYANSDFGDSSEMGFMSEFSSAVAILGDCGFSTGGFDCSTSCGCAGGSCGSFSSVG